MIVHCRTEIMFHLMKLVNKGSTYAGKRSRRLVSSSLWNHAAYFLSLLQFSAFSGKFCEMSVKFTFVYLIWQCWWC